MPGPFLSSRRPSAQAVSHAPRARGVADKLEGRETAPALPRERLHLPDLDVHPTPPWEPALRLPPRHALEPSHGLGCDAPAQTPVSERMGLAVGGGADENFLHAREAMERHRHLKAMKASSAFRKTQEAPTGRVELLERVGPTGIEPMTSTV